MALRAVVRGLSELCITAGILIVLFVVHLLYWTGLRADSASDNEIDRLHERWAAAPRDGSAAADEGRAGAPSRREREQRGRDGETGPAGGAGERRAGRAQQQPYRDGRSFAVMYIPRFGRDWSKPVLESTGEQTLRRGLGHYTRTARLGGKGNFAVAGHRRTYGDPFKDFPRLRPGDPVVLTDGDTWYTYTIVKRPYRTLPGDTGVLDAVPAPVNKAAAPFTGPGRYLTLTTCDPEWGSSHRLIAWGRLDATRPASEGSPGALTR
ncbi:class E sortase [Streptomyces albus subsp. chlorinus]|uniref:class E sortase n=1 Tax=Streptomyces albus TaxID=1888 RepID=UPI00156D66C0|nr:class E sortase [Streptomyces albus subsp. chlorinus]